MNNVLGETIRPEIKAILGDKESRNEAPKTETKKCKKKTDKRLSGLLSRIRLETSSKINHPRKIKKLLVKYERSDPILEQYQTVRLKDSGGIRYTDVETFTIVTFKEIRETATHLYFDYDASQNSFMEDKINCVIEMVSMSGQNLKDEDDLWEFLKRKRLCVSKTFFVLRSKCINFENDDQDLPEINSYFTKTTTSLFGANQEEEEKPVGTSLKRKVCQTCCHTYQGNECIICVQNPEFKGSLEVDLNNLLSNNVAEFSQQLLDIPEAGFPNESVQDKDVRGPTIDELREIRVASFTEKKEVSIKLNRMAVKNDLIKAFQYIKVSQIWKIFVINLCYNKYAQTLNQKLIKVPL